MFLYSDEGLIEELGLDQSAIRTHGWNPGGMWGTDTVWQKDTNRLFLANNDHLYTTDALTDAVNGNKGWSGIRESFGKTTIQPGAATSYLMRFPGQWEDGLGSIFFHWARTLTFNGHFMQRDPISISGGLNVFSYASVNPNTRFDVYGLSDGPGFWDQVNPLDHPYDADYRDWFEKRFPKTIKGAINEFKIRIKNAACALVKTTPSRLPAFDAAHGEDNDIDIQPNMERFGDEPQSIWEAQVRIGKFQIKTTDVFLYWNNRNRQWCPTRLCFDYDTTMYILENTGANEIKGVETDYVFKERDVTMGK